MLGAAATPPFSAVSTWPVWTLLQLRDGDDVAGPRLRRRPRAPRRAAQQLAEPLARARSSRSAPSSRACTRARPDAEHRERARVAVDDRLEDDRGEGRRRVRLERSLAPSSTPRAGRGGRSAGEGSHAPIAAQQRRDAGAARSPRRTARAASCPARTPATRPRAPPRPRRARPPRDTSRAARRRTRRRPRRAWSRAASRRGRAARGTGPSPSGPQRHAAQHVDHALEVRLLADRERRRHRARVLELGRATRGPRRSRRARGRCRSRRRAREGRAPRSARHIASVPTFTPSAAETTSTRAVERVRGRSAPRPGSSSRPGVSTSVRCWRRRRSRRRAT